MSLDPRNMSDRTFALVGRVLLIITIIFVGWNLPIGWW